MKENIFNLDEDVATMQERGLTELVADLREDEKLLKAIEEGEIHPRDLTTYIEQTYTVARSLAFNGLKALMEKEDTAVKEAEDAEKSSKESDNEDDEDEMDVDDDMLDCIDLLGDDEKFNDMLEDDNTTDEALIKRIATVCEVDKKQAKTILDYLDSME